MTRCALVLAFVLAQITPRAALAREGIALPTGFDGFYAVGGMACDGLGRVGVKDGVMVGAEFAITVTDLIEFPGESNRVEATLLNEGGGGSWTDSAVLTLTDDGQSLRFDYPDGTATVWTRCP